MDTWISHLASWFKPNFESSVHQVFSRWDVQVEDWCPPLQILQYIWLRSSFQSSVSSRFSEPRFLFQHMLPKVFSWNLNCHDLWPKSAEKSSPKSQKKFSAADPMNFQCFFSCSSFAFYWHQHRHHNKLMSYNIEKTLRFWRPETVSATRNSSFEIGWWCLCLCPTNLSTFSAAKFGIIPAWLIVFKRAVQPHSCRDKITSVKFRGCNCQPIFPPRWCLMSTGDSWRKTGLDFKDIPSKSC